ncbi:MAG: glutamate racemase [Desulfobacteraceae bacterium 4572_88]|nr:MAG: glutamate racemase [Desulfobacteraceae bacterium 4572_88]RLC20435.1 MAG: glutamate racemase [Deltaproteobacteria bacterium]
MIGIFDSGIGGLTVARALTDQLPGYDMVYFGDTAHSPCGNKSLKTITDHALRASNFLLEKSVKLMLIASHTTSAAASASLAEKINIPIFEPITPAAESAIRVSKKFGIGVIGTQATIDSGVYEKRIHGLAPDARVCSVACPLLVPLLEEGWVKKPETRMIVKKYLHPLKSRQIDTLVLGCSHYPILKKIIQNKIGKRVRVVDASLALAEAVKGFLEAHPEIDTQMQREGVSRFFVSDLTEQVRQNAKLVFGKNVRIEDVEFGE